MARYPKRRFPLFIWLSIILFLLAVLTFPQWIVIFYPQPHRELVISNAYQNNVSPYLVFAIIRAESKYQSNAESSAGALGLMQIMPDTAKWIAEQRGIKDFRADQLMDPAINISFGCWYLSQLSKEFDGRLPLVIAAYNAGRGNVRGWVVNDQWDGNPQELEKIPFKETQQYVRNVLKNYEAYQAIYLPQH